MSMQKPTMIQHPAKAMPHQHDPQDSPPDSLKKSGNAKKRTALDHYTHVQYNM
jgi:hypothetical protein